MTRWTPFPYDDAPYRYTESSLKKHWPRLHRGDCEPLPRDRAVLDAWIAFHAGDFGAAVEAGVAAGPAGFNAANKAAAVYATYLETSEKRQLELFAQAFERAVRLQAEQPRNANAFYLYAFAAGRYSQRISVAKALAQGFGAKVRDALRRTLELEPKHADAHIAFGSWHAEIVDKAGAMIGGVTYGAKRDEALRHFRTALELLPDSAIARIEYANGIVLLDGKKALKQAEALYAEAAACHALDAMERLDVEHARQEIAA